MSENAITWDLGADRVLVLTMDDPTQPTNTINELFGDSLKATVDRLEAEKDSFDGVILTSAKKEFLAGGDLALLMNAGPGDEQRMSDYLTALKTELRRIELLGKPVVAAINGAALGGGYELALACHHRIAVDAKGSQLGLPEVQLGVLPGAGGITRTVRMFGIADAMLKVVGEGKQYKPRKALEIGLVDAVVDTQEEMLAAARAWIKDNPAPVKPWDQPDFTIPGGTPADKSLQQTLPAFPANLRKQLKGAPMPAPLAALATAVEGAQVDFDNAQKIETRYCVSLICGQVSTNMIKALFFDLGKINKGMSRPEGIPERKAEKVLILGAGMMGAAIAYVTARSGAQVILKDISVEAAERGKGYSAGLLDKAVERGRITQEKRDEVLARIHPTAEAIDAACCDFVVEAVFEDVELKQRVFGEFDDILAPDAVLGSNTSTLSITKLAGGIKRPEEFIGLHFFSPVDKMPLLEIIVGEKTSDETLARAIDYAQQIKKVPIVVNDSHGFFTSRVIGQFLDEATTLVAEGVHPASVEQAAAQAGFPAGPLTVLDEVTLSLIHKIHSATLVEWRSQGRDVAESPGLELLGRMVTEFDRPGRSSGRGFYDYDADGKRLGLSPDLVEIYTRNDHGISLVDMQERMLFAQAIDTVRCFDEGVLRSTEDANIGSIMGIGFPPWTGGVAQYMNQYPGGLAGFVARADELLERYGDRFTAPDSLRAKAAAGETY